MFTTIKSKVQDALRSPKSSENKFISFKSNAIK
jgi:hypothetical protein